MTDFRDPRPPRDASTRTWWLRGGFGGLRYEAGLGVRVLLPASPEPSAGLLRAPGPPESDPRPGRTQIEAWEWEGGAVAE